MVNYAAEESQLIYARKGHLLCVAGRNILTACATKLLDICHILQGKKQFIGAFHVAAKSAFYCCHARLPSVCLSVRPSVSPPVYQRVCYLKAFREICYWGLLGKICHENTNFLAIRPKYRAVYDAIRTFLYCRRYELSIKVLLYNTQYL